MTTFQTDQHLLFFSKKFGLITEKQLILTNGKKLSKIKIDSIAKVSLHKHRVFFLNSLLFILSAGIFTLIYLFYESEKMELYLSFTVIAILILVYSIMHKFYSYKIIIREKDRSIFEIHANQLNRKIIKEFYSTIVKHIPKNQIK
jgi:hypothetical protein